MRQLPIARAKDLIVRELPDEVLVYDLDADKAHCLNQTAALIWKNCDGQKSASQIARLLEQELKSPVSEQVVLLGLQELATSRLLKEKTWVPPAAGLSRRRLIQSLGLAAAIGLPLILSIPAPTAAQAGSPCTQPSNRPDGCPCSDPAQCIATSDCVGGICTQL